MAFRAASSARSPSASFNVGDPLLGAGQRFGQHAGGAARRLFGDAAQRFGHFGDALFGDAQRLADAAGCASRRVFGHAGEALAQAEQLGGKRRDLLLRVGQPLR